jgi:hypothetical protein
VHFSPATAHPVPKHWLCLQVRLTLIFFSEVSTHPIHIPTDLVLLGFTRTIDLVRKIFSDKLICVRKNHKC